MLPKAFPRWVLVANDWEISFQDGLSAPVMLKYHTAGSQGIITSRTADSSGIKSAAFSKILGLAPIHAAKLKSLKLTDPMLAVQKAGLLGLFRKFCLKHFSHV